MSWIKEVEMVESVDDPQPSRSIQGYIQFPSFNVGREDCVCYEDDHPEFLLQEKKVSMEEQKSQTEDRFFRGRQIAYMIYDCFWVIGVHDTVLDYADSFIITLTSCDDILLSTTKIPPDDFLDSLYKLRIRESDQLKTVLELYDIGNSSKDIDAQ